MESPPTDVFHVVRDVDGGHLGAAHKSSIPDARHAVGDGDAFNAFIFNTFKNCACFVKYEDVVIHGRIDKCRYKDM